MSYYDIHNKLFIEDLSIQAGDLIVLRADLNVPLLAGEIQNDRRIRASLPSIEYLQKKQARTLVLSHLGRPKGQAVAELRLAPVAAALTKLLGQRVHYAEDCVGAVAHDAIQKLQPGAVLLLENVRFHNAEKTNDAEFARQLAHQAKYFVNDAFGTAHRAHASTSGIAKHVQASAAGYLVAQEIRALAQIAHDPKRPYLAVCGGAKIADKIALFTKLLNIVDQFLIGGAMAFTFLKAMGHECGLSLVEKNQIEQASAILDQHGSKIKLPLDFMVTAEFDFAAQKVGELRSVAFDQIPSASYALDIGPATIQHFSALFANARTIFWNGPMGLNELSQTARGSLALAQSVANANARAFTVVGGGDTLAIVTQAQLEKSFGHVSTGGGAALSFVEGSKLPGIDALSPAA